MMNDRKRESFALHHVTVGGKVVRHTCLHTTPFVYISKVKVTLGAKLFVEIKSYAMFIDIT